MKKSNPFKLVARAALVFALMVSLLLPSLGMAASGTAPEVLTAKAVSAGKGAVTLGGNVTSNSGLPIIERGVVYDTKPMPTISYSTRIDSAPGTGAFSMEVGGLLAGRTYYARAFVRNSAGFAYGQQIEFNVGETAPAVTTSQAKHITLTSVTLGGNVTLDGGKKITERGIVYATHNNPVVSKDNKSVVEADTGAFTVNLSGLKKNTRYYARAYARNDKGFSYGNLIAFTTSDKPTAPILGIRKVTSITTNSAVVGGDVISNGGSKVVELGVVYSTKPNPTLATGNKAQTKAGDGQYALTLKNLARGQVYYVRPYARNLAGTSYGEQQEFTTTSVNATVPVLGKRDITSITTGSAIVGGNVLSNGGATVFERGVVYSIKPNPTLSNANKAQAKTGDGSYALTLSGLARGQVYYVRSYARNAVGTAYGEQQVFKASMKPKTDTISATEITTTTAKLSGIVSDDMGSAISERGFIVSTNDTPTLSRNEFQLTAVGTTGAYTAELKSLTPGMTYFFRSYARNEKGVTYGSIITFKTAGMDKPNVSTLAPTEVTLNGAVIGGNVTAQGNSAVTERGIVLSTSDNPTVTANQRSNTSSGTVGSFTIRFTGLSENVTYYARAYAKNAAGITYGNTISFTTKATLVPTITTSSASNISGTSATLGGNVVSDGGNTITERGVLISTSQSVTLQNYENKYSVQGTTGSFTTNAINLLAGKTYYFVAYAVNSSGVSYGTVMNFITRSATSPEVTTTSAAQITSTSALLGGTVISDGGYLITERGVVVSNSPDPTITNYTKKFTDPGTTGAFAVSGTGLSPNLLYYARAYARNALGVTYGNQVTFYTLNSTALASVTLEGASGITNSTASLSANVASDGGTAVLERGFVLDLTTQPTISSYAFKIPCAGTVGAMSAQSSGLQAGKNYYVRAYVVTAAGTAYSNQISFYTTGSAQIPTVGAIAISDVTATTAQLSSIVNSDGGSDVLERGFVIGTNPMPETTTNLYKLAASGTTGAFSVTANNLTSGVTYYVRAYAINASGIAYGAQSTLITANITTPTLTTTEYENVAQTTVTLKGTVSGDGGSPITERGVVYSTSPTPTVSASQKAISTTNTVGSYTVDVTALSAGTTYYARCYAINAQGVSYGSEITFKTQD